ncbi:hypothetical protein AAKU58_000251 [Oxalobacteraceae bacterium GrIS 1.18]
MREHRPTSILQRVVMPEEAAKCGTCRAALLITYALNLIIRP